eukprot:m.68740 g.68740  ORF g.68740 m.68740 type:complete len:55 (+) comp7514_c0_seq4:570-734(+)
MEPSDLVVCLVIRQMQCELLFGLCGGVGFDAPDPFLARIEVVHKLRSAMIAWLL